MRPLYFPCCQHICRVHNDEKTQSPILCDWGCLRCVARGLVDLFQSHYWAGKLSGSFRHAQLQSGALAKCSLQSSNRLCRFSDSNPEVPWPPNRYDLVRTGQIVSLHEMLGLLSFDTKTIQICEGSGYFFLNSWGASSWTFKSMPSGTLSAACTESLYTAGPRPNWQKHLLMWVRGGLSK